MMDTVLYRIHITNATVKLRQEQKMPFSQNRSSHVKRTTIIQTSLQLFRAGGFVGTTLESIARDSRCTLSEMYAEFADKGEIFGAIVSDIVERECRLRSPMAANASDLRAVLIDYGRQIIALSGISDLLFCYQLAVSEAAAAPELSRAFYEFGPRYLAEKIRNLIVLDCEKLGVNSDVAQGISNRLATMLYAQIHIKRLYNDSTALQDVARLDVLKFTVDAIARSAHFASDKSVGMR